MNKQNFKIGLYVRNSDPKQDTPEGTVKNQEQRLRQYVELRNLSGDFGEVVEVYIDRSLSAKNMNRPAIQRLLKDVVEGKIDMVAVSELSRITRNMRDFGEVWELFQKHKCGFLSLRENVDTGNAAGEMVMFMLANIAQFERKQTSERVAASHKIRSSRGLYNGGVVPLGYRTISHKKGYLEIDPERAKTVIRAFDYFLKHETLSRTAKHLNDDGIRISRQVQGGGRWQRLNFFTVDNLHNILTNKSYKGVKVWKDGGKECEAPAVWKAIVSAAKFDRVQKILRGNHRRKKPFTPKRYPYILSGLTSCAQCGDVMCGKSAHGSNGKKYGYYEHSWASKKGSTFTKGTFQVRSPSGTGQKIGRRGLVGSAQAGKKSGFCRRDFGTGQGPFTNGREPGRRCGRIQSEVSGYNSNLEALAERLGELPKDVSASLIYRQMEKLEEAKRAALDKLQEVNRNGAMRELPAQLTQYRAFLGMMGRLLGEVSEAETRAKIVARLVHRVEIGTKGVVIHYYAGAERASGEESPDFFECEGSSSLTNGTRERT